MNALNSKANEPSMEEILASIRRIISDDEERIAATAAAGLQTAIAETRHEPPRPAPEPAPEPAAVQYAPPPVQAPPRVEPAPRPVVDPAPRPVLETSPRPSNHDSASVLSRDVDDTVGHAFRTLEDTARSRGPLTIEALVVETIRPMLREWLDAHLPGLVKEMVRDEIERIARRAR